MDAPVASRTYVDQAVVPLCNALFKRRWDEAVPPCRGKALSPVCSVLSTTASSVAKMRRPTLPHCRLCCMSGNGRPCTELTFAQQAACRGMPRHFHLLCLNQAGADPAFCGYRNRPSACACGRSEGGHAAPKLRAKTIATLLSQINYRLGLGACPALDPTL